MKKGEASEAAKFYAKAIRFAQSPDLNDSAAAERLKQAKDAATGRAAEQAEAAKQAEKARAAEREQEKIRKAETAALEQKAREAAEARRVEEELMQKERKEAEKLAAAIGRVEKAVSLARSLLADNPKESLRKANKAATLLEMVGSASALGKSAPDIEAKTLEIAELRKQAAVAAEKHAVVIEQR
jgi:hypothetical protein